MTKQLNNKVLNNWVIKHYSSGNLPGMICKHRARIKLCRSLRLRKCSLRIEEEEEKAEKEEKEEKSKNEE